MTTIFAKTILRSRHAQRPDKVLSTLLLRYPRCIHAEFMTHRMLSKNSASSRAIPVSKLIQDVLDDPFIPLFWGKNQTGMQAYTEHDAPVIIDYDDSTVENWVMSRDAAWRAMVEDTVEWAKRWEKAGYHKQIVNRLLEPFSHITVVASGTEWSNFRALRDHPAAEPHIQILAREIGVELDRTDNIQTLEPGQWHLPFIEHVDIDEAKDVITGDGILRKVPMPHEINEILIKKSVACCASTSYKTVDGFDMTLEKAIELHDKLVGSAPLHASPAEHVAQADTYGIMFGEGLAWQNPDQHGNLKGFRQYRKMLPNECL